MQVQKCGDQESYYASSSRRLLGGHRIDASPAPSLSASADARAQRANLERALGVTTVVLFVASLSYIALSTLYACLRGAGGRREEEEGPGGDSAAAPAASDETKRALEEIPVHVVVVAASREGGGDREEEGEGEAAPDCAVCLAEYAAGDEVCELPACRHGFHRECVDRWLLTRAPTCPICRAPVGRVAERPDDSRDDDCAV